MWVENFFKKCVKFTHLLFIDLRMPLTLDDHSCIRLTWVQVLDQRGHLVFWTDLFAEMVSVTFSSPNSWQFFGEFSLMLVCCLQFRAEMFDSVLFQLVLLLHNCWWSTDQLYFKMTNCPCEYKLVVLVLCNAAFFFGLFNYQVVQHTSSFTPRKLFFSLEIFFAPGWFPWSAMQKATLLQTWASCFND